MKITAPYGYGAIVPLQKTHRVRLPAGAAPAFCRRLNALAISVAEFSAAARDYPIVFATLDRGKSFAPVAVLGLEQNANLFVDAAGQWDRAAYLPAFVRRYPFCISKMYVDGAPSGARAVCVATDSLDEAGTALFDAEGRPTASWQAIERLLTEFEADLDRTAKLCAALARLRLMQPFSLQTADDGPQVRLAGMYRISEAKLKDLKPASHKMLVNQDYMGRIYAHLHSLDNFSRLAGHRRGG